MQNLATLFKQYSSWFQIAAISLLIVLLTVSFTRSTSQDAEAYLTLLGNLTLPYLISGDQVGLQQSLDLVIQDTPVLEARILNTENRPLVQVVNRGSTGGTESEPTELASELVLEQTLLGTLTISVAQGETNSPAFLIVLALVALGFTLSPLFLKQDAMIKVTPAQLPSNRSRNRFVIAISISPIVEQLKQQGASSSKKLHLMLKIIRQLAPSYGLEYVALNGDMLVLQTNSDDKLSLRQAVVFSWNACQSLGAEKGFYLKSSICPAELPGDSLSASLMLAAGDEIENCSDLQAGCAAGTVSLTEDLVINLPKEWDVVCDNSKQRFTISELPSAVCNLWRRQLNNLVEN